MQYYQASREVEISEAPGQRAHRTSLRFLQRGRLPRTVLAHDDRARSCDVFDTERDYYSLADFLVGATVHVFGREMTVIDVDDATQAFFLTELGIDQRSRRRAALPAAPARAPVARAPSSLVPKVPRKDAAARDGYFCRWQATLATAESGGKAGSGEEGVAIIPTAPPAGGETVDYNALRRFTVCFSGDERAVTIYESRQAGFTGGMFLKPTRDLFRREDFRVGRVLTINSFRFRLDALDKEGHVGADSPGGGATSVAEVAGEAQRAQRS